MRCRKERVKVPPEAVQRISCTSLWSMYVPGSSPDETGSNNVKWIVLCSTALDSIILCCTMLFLVMTSCITFNCTSSLCGMLCLYFMVSFCCFSSHFTRGGPGVELKE